MTGIHDGENHVGNASAVAPADGATTPARPHRRPRGGLERRRVATRREQSRAERLLLGALGIVVVLGVWQLLSSVGVLDPLIASSPRNIVESARDLVDLGVLGPAVLSTLKLFAIGFGIALASGLLIGVALGWYQRANALLDPWVSILYATPRLALIPVIMAWLGVGLKSQIVIVWLIAVFPVIVNVSAGVAAIDRDHLRVARSFLASNRDVLRTVAIPGAMPMVLAGVRQGMMLGLTGVVVAEYFVGNSGVGGLIVKAGLTLETGQAFVGAIIFAIGALVLTAALRVVERRVNRWR